MNAYRIGSVRSPQVFSIPLMPVFAFMAAIFFALAHASTAVAASRYWVGGTGDWSDTGHWSTASGGVGGADVPTSSDDVFIDENSGIIANDFIFYDPEGIGYVTFCHDFISRTGVSYFLWTIPENDVLTIYGSADIESGLITQWGVDLQGNEPRTLKTNGGDVAYISIGGSVYLTLLDDLTSSVQIAIAGSLTFDANGFDITSDYFYLDSCTLKMGSGTWTAGTWQTCGSETILPDTSTLKVANGLGDTYDYHKVCLTGSGDVGIAGGRTFDELTADTTVHSIIVEVDKTLTVNHFNVSGDAENTIQLKANGISGGAVSTSELVSSGGDWAVGGGFFHDNPFWPTGHFQGAITSVDGSNHVTGYEITTVGGGYVPAENVRCRDNLGRYFYINILTTTPIVTQFNLSQPSGVVSCDYLDISHCNATGGADWYAGSHSVNTGDNNGWIFAAAPIATPSNYAEWIAGYPGTGAEAAEGDDPDGDGWTNGTEYNYWKAAGEESDPADSGKGGQAIGLNPGWNLIGISADVCWYAGAVPGEAERGMIPASDPDGYVQVPSILSVLQGMGIAGKVSRIAGWHPNAGGTANEPVLYVNGSLDTLKYLAGGYGYWVNVTEACTWKVGGKPRLKARGAGKSVKMYPGWNMLADLFAEVHYTGENPAMGFGTDETGRTAEADVCGYVTGMARVEGTPAPGMVEAIVAYDGHAPFVHTYYTDVPAFLQTLRYAGPGMGMAMKIAAAAGAVTLEFPAENGVPVPTPTVTPDVTSIPTPTPTPTQDPWYVQYGPADTGGLDQVVQIGNLYVARWMNSDGAAMGTSKAWTTTVPWGDGLVWLGKDDWRMPSLAELSAICEAKDNLGSYDTGGYSFSSFGPTGCGSGESYSCGVYIPNCGVGGNSTTGTVRAVRLVTIPPTPTPDPWYPQYGPFGACDVVKIGSVYVATDKSGIGCAGGATKTFAEAATWAEGLDWLGRSSGWRMPRKFELDIIGAAKDTAMNFTYTVGTKYWSGTTYPDQGPCDSNGQGWEVWFRATPPGCYDNMTCKTLARSVRAVRDAENDTPDPTYTPVPTATETPTVTPTLTPIVTPTVTPTPDWYTAYGPSGSVDVVQIGSMYVACKKDGFGCAEGGQKTWEEGLSWAAGLDWLGIGSGWRLPTHAESVQICALYRWDVPGPYMTFSWNWYWNSDLYTGYPAGRAWQWDVYGCGECCSGIKTQPKFVRVVHDVD